MWQKISYGNGTTLDSDVANSEVSQKRERGCQEQSRNDIEQQKVWFFRDFMTSKEGKKQVWYYEYRTKFKTFY